MSRLMNSLFGIAIDNVGKLLKALPVVTGVLIVLTIIGVIIGLTTGSWVLALTTAVVGFAVLVVAIGIVLFIFIVLGSATRP